MQGDSEILDVLNEVLTAELTAINQYFLHAKMCGDWGYERLHAKIRHESIDEMHHAEALVDRILYLEGLPNLQRLWKLRIGENVEEILRSDLALEYEAIPRLNAGIAKATEKNDNGTRALLEQILRSEEEHVDWLEAQLTLIEQVGLPNYLTQQLKPENG